VGKLRKCGWEFVQGVALAASIAFALPLLAQEPVAMSPAQNLASSETVSVADESASLLASANTSGQVDEQDAYPQPSAPYSGDATQSATEIQKTQLAVNPITGLVPVSATHYAPLTLKQRWKVYWTQTYFSYGAYFKPVMFALVLDQTTNSPSQWGGGFRGFGLRVASRTASGMVQGTIRAPIAAALHEDVRYVYSGRQSRKRRLLYAVEYSFLTYNDQHRPTLNVAKLVGYFASTAISTEWHPPQQSLARYTFVNGSEQLGLSVPINILQEFWPFFARQFAHLY
jgi:hypothetical protein